MASLAAAFNAITTRPATLTRPGPVTYVDRKPVHAASVTHEIRASIQPIKSDSQRELMQLPEGDRNEARSIIYTRFRVETGDIIEADGERHAVLSKDNWQPLGGFSKAILGGMKA